MDIQRARNLTTDKLHTKMSDIYEDIEFCTQAPGIMTHQILNAIRALTPWLREKITDPRFWDDQFDVTHTGTVSLEPMTADEQAEFWERYKALPSLFTSLNRKGEQ